MKSKIVFLALSLFLANSVSAQTAIGLLGPAPIGGPQGNGPSTSSQTVTLYSDETTASDPEITATYRLSNQQYTSIEGHPNTPGIVFGSSITAGSDAIAPDLLYPLVETYGNHSDYYTACYNCEAGTGIDIATSHAIQIQSFTDALIDRSGANLKPVNAKVWFADLSIDFNIPVTNPVFHFTGLGAWVYKCYTVNGKIANYDLGISAEFDLLTTDASLRRLSGNSSFGVAGNTIKNTASYLGDGNPIHGIPRSSAAGSAVVIGTNISTVTFRISIKGDGGIIVDNAGTRMYATNGNFVAWSLVGSASDAAIVTTAGDGFLLGISLKAPETEKITLQAYPETETLKVLAVKTGDIIELSATATGTVVLNHVAISNNEVVPTHTLASGMYTVNVYSPEHHKKHSQKVIKQ
jgi:hypothetical protein